MYYYLPRIYRTGPIENPKSIRKLVIILGGSIIKHTNRWKIGRKIKRECKVFVIAFLGTSTQCMANYMKPSIRAKQNHFMLHVRNYEFYELKQKTGKSNFSISLIIKRVN